MRDALRILPWLTPSELAISASVCKEWRRCCSQLWARWMASDYRPALIFDAMTAPSSQEQVTLRRRGLHEPSTAQTRSNIVQNLPPVLNEAGFPEGHVRILSNWNGTATASPEEQRKEAAKSPFPDTLFPEFQSVLLQGSRLIAGHGTNFGFVGLRHIKGGGGVTIWPAATNSAVPSAPFGAASPHLVLCEGLDFPVRDERTDGPGAERDRADQERF